MINVLTTIKTELETLNIPYTFDEWDKQIKLPQFIGEITELPTYNEDGKSEYSFILNGYAKSYGYLFDVASQLKSKYKTSSIINGIVIKYDNTTTISSDKDDLKQIEIKFTVKEWGV